MSLPMPSRVALAGLMLVLAAPTDPAGAGGPPGLPDAQAITAVGIYQPGTPCGRVIRDDGTFILVPTPLHGIAPGARVKVMGERMGLEHHCGAPALVIRGWLPEPG